MVSKESHELTLVSETRRYRNDCYYCYVQGIHLWEWSHHCNTCNELLWEQTMTSPSSSSCWFQTCSVVIWLWSDKLSDNLWKSHLGILGKSSLLPVCDIFDLVNWDYTPKCNKKKQIPRIFLRIFCVIISHTVMQQLLLFLFILAPTE